MIHKAFLDTDIIIDFLINRQPHSVDAATLFQLSQSQQLELFVSSLSISNIHYVVSRLTSKKKAIGLIKQLLPLIHLLPVGETTIQKSLLSAFKDFEDGIQNFCAEEAGLSTLVTRNIKDYSKSQLSIQTPAQYLISIQS